MINFISKQIIKAYFNSWWLPALVFLILLAGFAVTAVLHWKPIGVIANGLLIAAGLALMGVFFASVWNLIRRRWAKGFVNLLLVPVCSVAAVFVFGFLMLPLMFGPSEDGFSDNLKIPANIEFAEPSAELNAYLGGEQDSFQSALLAALQVPGGGDTSVTGTITSLARLQEFNPDILRRYIASSPAWRVFEERGNVFATRRWMIGSEWRYDLHGYYTRHDIGAWSKSGTPDFQSRFTIGLSGAPWWRGNKDTTRMNAGDTAKVKLSEGNQMHESHCVISTDSMVVEVFEASSTMPVPLPLQRRGS